MERPQKIEPSEAYILIVGDIMLDEYIIGAHTRQSPEADVPVILSQEIDYRLGGAGNVAANLNSLGISTGIISVIGSDEKGYILKSLTKQNDIEAHFIEDNQRPTTVKQRIVNEKFEQYLRIDTEVTSDLTVSQETQIIIQVQEQIASKKVSGIVLQDYNKGVLTDYVIKHVQEISKENKIPLFVDPKFDRFRLLSDCTVFKPNIKELSEACGYKVKVDAVAIKKGIENLSLKADKIFVTLGAKGMYYLDNESNTEGLAVGQSLSNADVSGAGDSVLAALIWAYIAGNSVKQMAEKANKAGAVVCSKSGVSKVNISELE